jgi:sugar O-acyltransferase (sialic acid O-acetyltransferase NeuD family)
MLEGFIFGSGAQGRVTLDILRLQNPQTHWSFVDDNPEMTGKVINGAEVIGGLDKIQKMKSCFMHVALGKPSLKEKITKRCEELKNITFINAIHPSAIILPTVKLGIGIFIGAGVIINTEAVIKNGALINTQSVVEHDSVVGEFANISPTACLGGRVNVGSRAFIGSGSIILARTSIGDDSIIGMGAIVTKDIPKGKIAYGVPAKIIRESSQADWSKIL